MKKIFLVMFVFSSLLVFADDSELPNNSQLSEVNKWTFIQDKILEHSIGGKPFFDGKKFFLSLLGLIPGSICLTRALLDTPLQFFQTAEEYDDDGEFYYRDFHIVFMFGKTNEFREKRGYYRFPRQEYLRLKNKSILMRLLSYVLLFTVPFGSYFLLKRYAKKKYSTDFLKDFMVNWDEYRDQIPKNLYIPLLVIHDEYVKYLELCEKSEKHDSKLFLKRKGLEVADLVLDGLEDYRSKLKELAIFDLMCNDK